VTRQLYKGDHHNIADIKAINKIEGFGFKILELKIFKTITISFSNIDKLITCYNLIQQYLEEFRNNHEDSSVEISDSTISSITENELDQIHLETL
jgi:hypothetical protein